MSTTTIIVIIAVIVVLALAVLVLLPMLRRRRLQERFGPEYDRAVERHEDRTEAERDLVQREKRHAELDIRPLSEKAREEYAAKWARVQAGFVDSPEDTIRQADQLLTQVMAERGYPTDGYEQQLSDLSIEHAKTLDHYRTAHETRERIGAGVSTEDLRTAMVHYRTVFADLLGSDVGPDRVGDAGTREPGTPDTGAGADRRADAPDVDRRDIDPGRTTGTTDARRADADPDGQRDRTTRNPAH